MSGAIDDARLPGADRGGTSGLELVVQIAAGLRRAAGLPVPDPSSESRRALVALTGATLAAIGGAPLDAFISPLRTWEEGISSLEEARTDLAALRATLETRLAGAGATPNLHRLVEALVAGQIVRLDPSAQPVDRLTLLAGRRPRGESPGRHRSRPPGRLAGALTRPGSRQARRARPPRSAWSRGGRVLPLVPWWPAVAVAATLTAWLSLAPASPEIALLPNGRVPPTVPVGPGGAGPAGPAAPAGQGGSHQSPAAPPVQLAAGGAHPSASTALPVETEVVAAATLPLNPAPPAVTGTPAAATPPAATATGSTPTTASSSSAAAPRLTTTASSPGHSGHHGAAGHRRAGPRGPRSGISHRNRGRASPPPHE